MGAVVIAFINFTIFYGLLVSGFRCQVSGGATTAKKDRVKIPRQLIYPDTRKPIAAQTDT